MQESKKSSTRAKTPLEAALNVKLANSTLEMQTPFFCMLAAETLNNQELFAETRGFLATRLQNDTKVQ